MARIVTVYTDENRPFLPVDMSLIRWLKISEALARQGHEVDIATREPGLRARFARRLAPGLRRLPLRRVRWDRYDVVKTLFHMGFETLERFGGADHPFIISKLGSVVGAYDRRGVYFSGAEREALYRVQQRIAARARHVSVLSEPSRELWRRSHPDGPEPLLVPGAADVELPPDGGSPYAFSADRPVCVFAGNFYDEWYQASVHRRLVQSLNALGPLLAARGIDLHVVGYGDASRLDRRFVTFHGAAAYDRSWDFLRHAAVGIVLAFGPEANENESTKIYHYLRVGLPTVCERGFPNEDLIEQLGLGTLVRNGDTAAMADAVLAACGRSWEALRTAAIREICARHSWDERARRYAPLIRSA